MAKDKARKLIEKKNNALATLTIVYKKRTEIRPNPWNPNRQDDHHFELLCKSMEEDGFTVPVLVNDGTHDAALLDMICDGEHRWRASARVFGEDCEIPVVYVPYTLEQMMIATVRHNVARGEHDLQLEADLLRDLQSMGALDWAQDSLMMDDVEMQRLLEDVPASQKNAAEEFGQAWEPDKVGDDEVANQSTQVRTIEATTHGGVMQSAMTAKAIEETRERERKIQQATNEEEKAQAKKESRIYRLSLVFAGDESDIIRAALGKEPAVKLLAMCRAELGS